MSESFAIARADLCLQNFGYEPMNLMNHLIEENATSNSEVYSVTWFRLFLDLIIHSTRLALSDNTVIGQSDTSFRTPACFEDGKSGSLNRHIDLECYKY